MGGGGGSAAGAGVGAGVGAGAWAAAGFPDAPRAARRPAPKPGRNAPRVDPSPFVPGVRVIHKTFGPGKVVARQGDIATLLFDDGQEKRFSLSTALKQKQLKREQ